MKKILLILFFWITALSLSACSPENCPHFFSKTTIVKEATCLEKGEQVTKCYLCSFENRTVIPMLPHTEVVDEVVRATCSAYGLTEGSHCSVCNKVLVKQNRIRSLEHTFGEYEIVKEPTCTENGDKVRYCQVCSAENHKVIELLPHVEVTDEAVDPTFTTTGLTEGTHCSVCNIVLIAQKEIPMLEKVNISFPGGYITKASTTIQTKHLELQIPANVYVPDNIVEVVDILTDAVEKVTGLSFDGNPHYVRSELFPVIVNKANNTEHEFTFRSECSQTEANINSGELIELFTLVHEITHAIHFRQSFWAYCEWAFESITTYTEYKVLLYLEKYYPELMELSGSNKSSRIFNYSINDYNDMNNYSKLYAHPMEYWIYHYLEEDGFNGNYGLAFHFAWYLDETYGDYTKWITAYENYCPWHTNFTSNSYLDNELNITAFKIAYGESVFDNFYEWLKENEEVFNYQLYHTTDLRAASKFNIYPDFMYENTFELNSIWGSFDTEILYNNLYIGLDAGKYYLTEYKHKNIDNLTLSINSAVTVMLFNSKGEQIGLSEGDPTAQSYECKEIDLTGVSFVKLVGEGALSHFSIEGFN